MTCLLSNTQTCEFTLIILILAHQAKNALLSIWLSVSLKILDAT